MDTPIITSASQLSEKALVEIKTWLEPWFEGRRKGGVTGHIDSTENVGLPWGVQSADLDTGAEETGLVLSTDGVGGSVWSKVPSGNAFETWRECVLANPNLVFYWPCDEASGDLIDLVAGRAMVPTTKTIGGTQYPRYSRTGPFTGMPTDTAVEFAGAAGVLAADDDRFEYSPSSGEFAVTFSGTHAYTVEAWIDPISLISGAGSDGRVFEFWNANIGQVIAIDMFSSSGAPRFATVRGNSGTLGGTAAEQVALGTYAYIRVTYDGTTLKLYMDEVLTASGASSTSITTNATIALGNNRNSGGTGFRPYPGRVAHFAVYDAALTTFCTDINPDGSGSTSAAEFMVLTADGSGGTYWDYPTVEVEYT